MTVRAKDSLGYGQLTSLGSSTLVSSVAGGIPAGAETVILQAESQSLRYRDDGTAPTASVGMILAVNTMYEFTVGQLAAMRVIETAGGAKLNIAFYGQKTA